MAAPQTMTGYLIVGGISSQPSSVTPPSGGTIFFYANDTSALYVWDPTGGGSVGAWDLVGFLLLDEDDMSTDSATAAASQQSIKEHVKKSTRTINTQTGTSYTAVLADEGKIVEMNNASANTLTIPLNSSVAYPVGTVIQVTQLGAGTTSVQGAIGVTLNGATGADSVTGPIAALSAQYDAVSLYKRATDTWVIQGAHGGVT